MTLPVILISDPTSVCCALAVCSLLPSSYPEYFSSPLPPTPEGGGGGGSVPSFRICTMEFQIPSVFPFSSSHSHHHHHLTSFIEKKNQEIWMTSPPPASETHFFSHCPPDRYVSSPAQPKALQRLLVKNGMHACITTTYVA